MTIKRVGFACKFMYSDQSLKPKALKEIQGPLNYRGTTIKWLRENQSEAQERYMISLNIILQLLSAKSTMFHHCH